MTERAAGPAGPAEPGTASPGSARRLPTRTLVRAGPQDYTSSVIPRPARTTPRPMADFHHVLVNTLLANVTTSYLWFALTFWVYLETRNVAVAGVIGAAYMGLLSVCSLGFGAVVDHNRKKSVMVAATIATLAAYAVAAAVWILLPDSSLLSLAGAGFWIFTLAILAGSIVENMRNIALSTTVTLLVPDGERDKANGLVGAVQGVAFMVTSVFSGLSIGFLGMGPTLFIALGATLLSFLHLLTVRIPEPEILTTAEAMAAAVPTGTPGAPSEAPGHGAPAPGPPAPAAAEAPAPHGVRTWWSQIDLRGSFLVIRAIPGLLALILFACFNNFIGGVFMALMDPYGLELMSPQAWGLVLGVTSIGFILGGVIISRTGLGTNPVRTLLLANIVVALIGMLFAVREHWWLFAAGIFLFMMVVPAAEATEQTILQRVVPYHRQGRVFGVAQSVETAASPISAFFVAIVAQSFVIPWMADGGQDVLGWLVGEGRARGMAVLFMAAGLIMLLIVLVAFASRPYRALSRHYADTRQSIPVPGAEAGAGTVVEAGAAPGAGVAPGAGTGTGVEAGTGARAEPSTGMGGEGRSGAGIDGTRPAGTSAPAADHGGPTGASAAVPDPPDGPDPVRPG